MTPTRTKHVLLALTVALAALLAGCSSGTDSAESAAVGGGGTTAPERAGSAPEGAGSEDLGRAPGDPVDVDTDRQVVTTAVASLAVEDPADGAQAVSELVESVGGRVDERSEQAMSGEDGTEGTVADLVVRVPADELTGVLAELEDLGD